MPLEAPHSTVPIKVLVTDLEMTQLKHLPRASKVAQWVKPAAQILPQAGRFQPLTEKLTTVSQSSFGSSPDNLTIELTHWGSLYLEVHSGMDV